MATFNKWQCPYFNQTNGYRSCLVTGTECKPDPACVLIAARQSTAVAEQTPTNIGSPKLPTLEECTKEAQAFAVYDLTYREYGVVRTVYDFICRQLRAGA